MSPEALLEACARTFDHIAFRVTGTCMAPLLPPGMQVILAHPALRRPRLGEVVLVRTPLGLRLHRLVWGPPFGRRRTKADRAVECDPSIARDDILGTVVACHGGGDPSRGRRWRTLWSLGMLLRKRARRLALGRLVDDEADA